MSIIYFILIVITFSHQSSSQPSPYSFRVQYIGHTRYVTPEEEAKRDYCTNFWCTNDAHYLFTKSSQYPNVDPCVDFKNFTVNKAEIIDHPDDRVYYRGFNGIAQEKYNERLRKVVAADFDPVKDNRVIRVMKNTFAHCVKSAHVLRHVEAHKDLVEHLWSINGSPYLGKHLAFNMDKFNETSDFGVWNLFSNKVPNDFTNESAFWSGENFNISRYFEIEPWYAMNLFFNLEVARCDDYVCLKRPSEIWIRVDDERYEAIFEFFFEIFRTLDDAIFTRPQLRKIMIDEVYRPAFKRKVNFINGRLDLEKEFDVTYFKKVKICDLREKLSREHKGFDWLEIINSELLEGSHVTEDDEIIIQGGLDPMLAQIKYMLEADEKTIADAFDITFIYAHRFLIISRFHNKQEEKLYGYMHGWQRWYTCIKQDTLEANMHPALLVMYERERALWDRTRGDFDRDLMDERADIVRNAEKFVAEAIDEFKRQFMLDYAPRIPMRVALDVLKKIKNLKIVISLQPKIFPVEILEDFYKELKLSGDENFMRSIWEIKKFHRRLRNEPGTSWRRNIDEVVDVGTYTMKFNINNGNIFFLSPMKVVYPLYHPLRPRFFNMATLFTEVTGGLFLVLQEYIQQRHEVFLEPSKTNVEVAFEHYQKWLRSHTELQIGANYLTNEQLFWVARSVVGYQRYHKTVPNKIAKRDRHQSEYLHVFFKQSRGFQDAYLCNLTERERKELNEFYIKGYEIVYGIKIDEGNLTMVEN